MDTDMFGSNQRPPMPRFAATYLPFFAAKSVCIGVYLWLKTGSVAAPLLQVFRVFRGSSDLRFFSQVFYRFICRTNARNISGSNCTRISSLMILSASNGLSAGRKVRRVVSASNASAIAHIRA